MIQIVISIPEERYNQIINRYQGSNVRPKDYEIAIINGTPLPKGHGALKDVDKIINDGISKGFCDWYDEMKYAETIIEADKKNEDEE